MKSIQKNMTSKEILSALEAKGITRAGIARDLGKSHASITQVINGTITSHAIRSHIAKCIKRPVEEIWPVKENPTKKGRPLTSGLYDSETAA